MPTDLERLGNALRATRVERGLSLREVAAARGLTPLDLGRIERGVASPSEVGEILAAPPPSGVVVNTSGTHWEGCWRAHLECAVVRIETLIAAQQHTAAPEQPESEGEHG